MNEELARLVRARTIEDFPLVFGLREQPAFRSILAEIGSTPPAVRLDRALDLLNVDSMRQHGVRLPEQVRSSLSVEPAGLNLDDLTAEVNNVKLELCFETPWPFVKLKQCFKITIDNVDVGF